MGLGYLFLGLFVVLGLINLAGIIYLAAGLILSSIACEREPQAVPATFSMLIGGGRGLVVRWGDATPLCASSEHYQAYAHVALYAAIAAVGVLAGCTCQLRGRERFGNWNVGRTTV